MNALFQKKKLNFFNNFNRYFDKKLAKPLLSKDNLPDKNHKKKPEKNSQVSK